MAIEIVDLSWFTDNKCGFPMFSIVFCMFSRWYDTRFSMIRKENTLSLNSLNVKCWDNQTRSESIASTKWPIIIFWSKPPFQVYRHSPSFWSIFASFTPWLIVWLVVSPHGGFHSHGGTAKVSIQPERMARTQILFIQGFHMTHLMLVQFHTRA